MPKSALPSYLPDTSIHLPVAQEIEMTLGLGKRFPANCNIVECLIELLETKGLEDAPNPEKRAAWLSALIQINTAGIAAGWVRAANTARSGNPLGGQFGRYPVAAFLLQQSAEITDLQTQGIAILYLTALMSSSLSSKSLQDIAHILRQAIAPSSDLTYFVSRFPTFSTYSEYCDSCSSHIATKGNSGISGEQDFLRSLSQILNLSQRLVKPNHIDPNIGSPRPAWETHQPIQGTRGIDVNLDSGHVTDKLVSIEDVDKGEAPQTKLLFAPPKPEGQEDITSDEAEIDAGARESRLWLSRHQRLVHNMTGRFTPFERRHIASFLHKELTSEVSQRQIIGGLLGLMYVMGRDLDSVFKTKVGKDGEIGPSGIYVRHVHPPADGYKSPPQEHPHLLPISNLLELKLPETLRHWINPYTNGPTKTLIDHLGISQSQASKEISTALAVLRNKGQFNRIRLDRIPAALALETSVTVRNDVIVYHLAGQSNHGAPMLGYYLTPSIQHMAKVYRDVTQSMMGI